jgi:uncharacterized membrane protein
MIVGGGGGPAAVSAATAFFGWLVYQSLATQHIGRADQRRARRASL